MDWKIIKTIAEDTEILVTVEATLTLEEYQSFREKNKLGESKKEVAATPKRKYKKKPKAKVELTKEQKNARARGYYNKKKAKEKTQSKGRMVGDDPSQEKQEKMQAVQNKINKMKPDIELLEKAGKYVKERP